MLGAFFILAAAPVAVGRSETKQAACSLGRCGMLKSDATSHLNAFDQREKHPFAAAYPFRRQRFPHVSGGGGGGSAHGCSVSGDGAQPWDVRQTGAVCCARRRTVCGQCSAWLHTGSAVVWQSAVMMRMCRFVLIACEAPYMHLPAG